MVADVLTVPRSWSESPSDSGRTTVGQPRWPSAGPSTGDDGQMDEQSAGSRRWPVARPIVQFFLVGLLAVVLVGIATAVAARRVGQREAIVDARTTTLVKAQNIVEPNVTSGLLTGQPAAVRRVDAAVRHGVLDRSLVRVKIWTRDGHIVYSDDPRLAGASYTLGKDEIAALDTGVIEAEVSDLKKPENRFDRPFGKLLEVYLPIRTPSGERLLFEAYYRYSAVSASGTRIWRSFAPISIGALVALELIQIPIAWSLARRLRERQRERERLLQQALDASDTQRPPRSSGRAPGRPPTAAGSPAACTTVASRTSPASRTRSPAPPVRAAHRGRARC